MQPQPCSSRSLRRQRARYETQDVRRRPLASRNIWDARPGRGIDSRCDELSALARRARQFSRSRGDHVGDACRQRESVASAHSYCPRREHLDVDAKAGDVLAWPGSGRCDCAGALQQRPRVRRHGGEEAGRLRVVAAPKR